MKPKPNQIQQTHMKPKPKPNQTHQRSIHLSPRISTSVSQPTTVADLNLTQQITYLNPSLSL